MWDKSKSIRFICSDSAIFFLLTVVALWIPGRKFNIIPIVFSIFAILKYRYAGCQLQYDIKPCIVLFLFYGLWIVIAGGMHYIALSQLNPKAFITVRPHPVEWGLAVLKTTSASYILFPTFMFALIAIFLSSGNQLSLLLLIPIIFIPSALVALYQEFIDIRFLNPTITDFLSRITGLSSDFNGFRISLFLIIPLSVFGSIYFNQKWLKANYIVLTILYVVILGLSRSRTGVLGVTLYLALMPAMVVWVKRIDVNMWKIYVSGVSIVVLMVIIFGIIGIKDKDSKSIILKRLRQKITFIGTYGIKKTLIATFDENSFLYSIAPSRTEMALYSVSMTAMHPFSGLGPGGFLRNIDNMRHRNGVPEVFTKHIDNANNQYLQMSSELGIFGCLINIILHIWPLWMVFCIKDRITDIVDRWAVSMGFTIICIMMVLYFTGPHIINVDVLWIVTVYLVFLFVTALKYGYKFPLMNMKIITIIMTSITVFFIWGTFDTTFGKRGYYEIQKMHWWPYRITQNHYDIEEWGEGQIIWCKENAIIEIPIKDSVPEEIDLKFVLKHPDIGINPVEVKYGGKYGPRTKISVNDNAWNKIILPITEEYIKKRGDLKNSDELVNSIILSFDVSRTWVPKKWGVNEDSRELGLAVLIPKL